MSVKNSLKIASIGIMGGMVFRILSVLYQFDRTTGFYKDNGVFAWIDVAFVLATAALSGLTTLHDKKTFFTPYSNTKNRLLGTISLFSGVGLLVMAAMQMKVYFETKNAQDFDWNEPMTSWVHLGLIGSSVIFGLLQIILVPAFFAGRNSFGGFPALYLISVLWGIFNLFFMFLYYSHSVLHQENVYTILSAALLLLALYYLSRYFGGVNTEHSARLFYVFGFPAVLVSTAGIASNLLVYFLLGISLSEVPIIIQMAQLSVALLVFVSLVTIRKYDLHEPAGSHRKKHRYYTSSKITIASTSEQQEAKRMRVK
ncbi:hypothetical protein [Scatolibacter rhodanostii]|uniref:hypothetical protein n=1 Tax=Scatolibacter rhodanostii TaxID=2014781 RepID=UPI000C083F69|nr:hypothetical protein [Scatolibacter rhodanostii]